MLFNIISGSTYPKQQYGAPSAPPSPGGFPSSAGGFSNTGSRGTAGALGAGAVGGVAGGFAGSAAANSFSRPGSMPGAPPGNLSYTFDQKNIVALQMQMICAFKLPIFLIFQ